MNAMLTKIGRSAYKAMGTAPIHLAFLAIPMAITWFVVRNATWWILVTFGSNIKVVYLHHADPAPRFTHAAIIVAWIVAYLVGAFAMQTGWVWDGYESVGRAENVSPTLLYLATPQEGLGCLRLFLFPFSLVLLVPRVVWLVVFTVVGLLGGRFFLARWLASRQATVYDISSGSPWRGRRAL
jgi:hypothetical protein